MHLFPRWFTPHQSLRLLLAIHLALSITAHSICFKASGLTSMYLPGLVFHSKPAAPLTVVNGITLALSSNRFSPLPKPAKEHLAMPQTYLQDMHGGSCMLVRPPRA